jgi:MFS family permease
MSAAQTHKLPPAPAYAWYALGVLTFINLVNYLDRMVLAPVLDSVKKSFEISDSQTGFLTTAFLWVYVLVSPLSGYFGDRISRRALIVAGILLWSLATVASAFSQDYNHLFVARAFTGVGEACYGIVAPAFLGDLFSKERRARTLSVFYLALPIGTAAGYAFGGHMDETFGHALGEPHSGFFCDIGLHEGWRFAFLFGGIPGILLSVLAMFLKEPKRGAQEAIAGEINVHEFQWAKVGELFRTKSFVANVAATTAMTFAIGGLQQWAPTFVQRAFGYGSKDAGTYVGIIVAITGTVGTMAGGFFADYARRWTQSAHFLIPGFTLGISAVALTVAVLSHDRTIFWWAVGVCIFFLFCNSGPLNAAILNVSPPAIRATAFAITIFTIHLLGDAISPTIIGNLSDFFQTRLAPSPTLDADRLRYAFLIAPPVMLVGAVVLLIYARHYPRDVAAMEQKAAAERSKPAASPAS